ncbi:MAG: HEAT repeat domain-containing protein [Elusimicrobia bacterium]|nr:HEAT repeat domain-containing protein [Elusimicrobiota bacterium]
MKLKWGIAVVFVTLGAIFGAKFVLLWLSAAFSEAPISVIFHQQGKWRGFLGLASDVQLASDSDPLIAFHAVSRLLHHCDQTDGMIRLAQKERRPEVQWRLLQSLGSCMDSRTIPIYLEALHSDNQVVVAVAAQSLGMLKAKEAIPELEPLVERYEPKVAGVIAYALSQIGERKVSYPWAVKVLSRPKPDKDIGSQDSLSRYYASKVLEEVGDRNDLRYLEMNKTHMGLNVEFKETERILRSRSAKN